MQDHGIFAGQALRTSNAQAVVGAQANVDLVSFAVANHDETAPLSSRRSTMHEDGIEIRIFLLIENDGDLAVHPASDPPGRIGQVDFNAHAARCGYSLLAMREISRRATCGQAKHRVCT